MKRILLSLALLVGVLIPAGLALESGSANATSFTFTCSAHHTIRDVGYFNELMGVGAKSQLSTLNGKNALFTVCLLKTTTQRPTQGLWGLRSEANGMWVGVNTADHNALTATVPNIPLGSTNGFGPHETFRLTCLAGGGEHWFYTSTGGFAATIASNPPTAWTNLPVPTVFHISGYC